MQAWVHAHTYLDSVLFPTVGEFPLKASPLHRQVHLTEQGGIEKKLRLRDLVAEIQDSGGRQGHLQLVTGMSRQGRRIQNHPAYLPCNCNQLQANKNIMVYVQSADADGTAYQHKHVWRERNLGAIRSKWVFDVECGAAATHTFNFPDALLPPDTQACSHEHAGACTCARMHLIY